jgi:hypothetical protein
MGTESANPVRIIDQRVDWFELRFRVVLEERFLAVLRDRAKTAKRNGGGKGGRAPFRWASGRLEDAPGVPLPDYRSRVLCNLIQSGDLQWSEDGKCLEGKTERGETEIAWWRSGCRGGQGERIEHAVARASSPHAVLVGQLRVTGKPGVYTIQNADNRVEIDTTAVELGPDGRRRPGWNVKVQWRAAYLAEHGADALLSRIIASECGSVVGAEIMRLDLAVTLAGWTVHDDDRLRVVKRSRSNVQRYYVGDVAPPMTAYGLKDCSGFMVSPGNDVVGRIYDKRRELATHGDARWKTGKDGVRRFLHASEKGRTELDIWRERGADPSAESIVRVEFQLRGAVLDELRLRDPRVFKGNVDAAWRYLVGTDSEAIDAAKLEIKKERARAARARRRGDLETAASTAPRIAELRAEIAAAKARGEGHPGWMRMIEPTEGRRKRAPLDARWRIVRGASFVGGGAGGAAQRSRRVRLGATLKQSIGATISALADADWLDRFRDHEIPVLHREFPRGDDRRYEFLTERQHLEMLSEPVQKHIVQHALQEIYARSAIIAAEQLLSEKGALDAAEWLVIRINACADRRAHVEWNRREAEIEARTGPDAPYPTWDAATKAAFLAAKAERDRAADNAAWNAAVIEPNAVAAA